MNFRRQLARDRHAAISEMIAREAIGLAMAPASRDEWLAQLVDLLSRSCGLRRKDEILRAVIEREETLPTAIGNGVAIPHAKTDIVPRVLLACGLAPAGVEFSAPDGKPVRIAFLLVSPRDAANQHVQTLAAISRIMIRDGAVDRLLLAESPRELIRMLKTEEEDL